VPISQVDELPLEKARAASAHGFTRWLIVGLSFMVAAVAYLDRSNISIAAPTLKKDLNLSPLELGTIFSAFLVGYAIAQPFAGRVADRFGPRRTIACGILSWSVLTALTASVPTGYAASFAILLVVRFLLGVGESLIFPGSNRLVASWIPTKERGLANGFIFAGVGVGAGLAPPIITALMITHDWRVAFFVTAIIGLAALIVWLVFVRDTPDEHPHLSAKERRYIEADRLARVSQGHQAVASWRSIIANRDIAVLTLSYFCFGYVAYIFFTWFFTYLSGVRGLDLKSSGIYGTLPFIAMAIASPGGGWISDRLAVRWGDRVGRCWLAAFGMALAAVFVALATNVSDARLASFVLALGSGSLYLAQSSYWTLSANVGRQSAGSVSGVMNMGCQVGGALVGVVTPVVAQNLGWAASFIFTAGVCGVGAVAWLFVNPQVSLAVPKSSEAQAEDM
jgi:ACS family glucarate transporter-like MFS transporter